MNLRRNLRMTGFHTNLKLPLNPHIPGLSCFSPPRRIGGVAIPQKLRITKNRWKREQANLWRHLRIILILFLVCFLHFAEAQTSIDWTKWNSLPPNPALKLEEPPYPTGFPKDGLGRQPGVAGMYSGISNGALMIAGGANFPYKNPWNGGQKVWWNDIYVLEKNTNGEATWVDSVFTLPTKMGYGVSIVKNNELICIGGENENGTVSDVIGLTWNSESQKVESRTLTALPDGYKAVSGGICAGEIFIHGIQNGENVLLRLNESSGQWIELPGCPGPPRSFAVGVVQNNGYGEALFLFSGRTKSPDGQIRLLTDGYMYDPVQNKWNALGPISVDGSDPRCIMGAASISIGASHIFVFGGDDGLELLGREKHTQEIRNASDTTKRRALERELAQMFEEHSGFSNQVLSYHTVTNTWNIIDTFSTQLPVTTQVTKWNGDYLITSGEVRPGVRTPVIWKGEIIENHSGFGWVNYSVIALYFLVMLLIGVKFARRQKSTDDYFKGGGRIPWWAAGLSLFGTSLSAITFMAIPAKTYMTDWGYFFFQMTPLITAPILIAVYIPYFRKLNITSAYEYLENRFNLLTRLLGSLSFMILQLGRVGIVLFLPSIAINLVTGISIESCILAMGVVSIIYTMMGGIEAVIWTDVLQVIILMGGALLCLILLLTQVDMNLQDSFDLAIDNEKFKILETSLDFTRPTIWVVILGGVFANLITSGSDQTMVQRYMTTSTDREAKQSVWTFAVLALPATLIFFTVGTVLYLYYTVYPAELNPTISNDDAIFPWYIVTELPMGISGLLIAGIFSAAMSSLSSSMNSVSTAFTTDFYHRFKWGRGANELKVARISTLVFGVLGTAFALMMASWNIQSLWDQFQLYVGLFAGGLGGLFLLGMTSKRANGNGAVAGLLGSAVIQYLLMVNTNMHVLLFAATGFVTCYVLSYLISILLPDSTNKNEI